MRPEVSVVAWLRRMKSQVTKSYVTKDLAVTRLVATFVLDILFGIYGGV
jgi:hypothetical protein